MVKPLCPSQPSFSAAERVSGGGRASKGDAVAPVTVTPRIELNVQPIISLRRATAHQVRLFSLRPKALSQCSHPHPTKILMKNLLAITAVAVVISGWVCAADLKHVDDFRAVAEKANALLTIPEW